MKLTTSKDWDEKWNTIFDHYQLDTRHAEYINALIEENENHILEIGAGSFRDMARLNKLDVDCHGVDFSIDSVNLAKKLFPKIEDKIHCMDAFNLQFKEEEFDLTYHNGFWVLFSDEQILKLANEQAKITKRRLIATVHNAHNINFFNYFEKMKAIDPLYNIRFFMVDEIVELMKKISNKIKVIPVGKNKNKHEDLLISTNANKSQIKKCLYDAKHTLLNESERLLVIIEI